MATAEIVEVVAEGPFWLKETDNELQVCGRNAKILYRYPLGQRLLADTHVARLQKGHGARQRRMVLRAEAMFSLIRDCEESFTADDSYKMLREACRKLIAEIEQ